MDELISRRNCGVLVDPGSPEQIARAVNDLLADEPRRERMADNARKAHLDELNYERQFAPLQKEIFAHCAGGDEGERWKS